MSMQPIQSSTRTFLRGGFMIFHFAVVFLGLTLLAFSAAGLTCTFSNWFSKWSPHPNRNPPALTWEAIGD